MVLHCASYSDFAFFVVRELFLGKYVSEVSPYFGPLDSSNRSILLLLFWEKYFLGVTMVFKFTLKYIYHHFTDR